jgi:glutaminyl-tRNA synthetase
VYSYIHWIADCPTKNSPVKATVRVFNSLFNSDSPDTLTDGFLSVVNPNSEEIFSNAMIETGLGEIRRRAPWPSLEGSAGRKMAGTHGTKQYVFGVCALHIFA